MFLSTAEPKTNQPLCTTYLHALQNGQLYCNYGNNCAIDEDSQLVANYAAEPGRIGPDHDQHPAPQTKASEEYSVTDPYIGVIGPAISPALLEMRPVQLGVAPSTYGRPLLMPNAVTTPHPPLPTKTTTATGTIMTTRSQYNTSKRPLPTTHSTAHVIRRMATAAPGG